MLESEGAAELSKNRDGLRVRLSCRSLGACGNKRKRVRVKQGEIYGVRLSEIYGVRLSEIY